MGIMGTHCLLVFAEESSLQGFSGGAGFSLSTVGYDIRRTRRTTILTGRGLGARE